MIYILAAVIILILSLVVIFFVQSRIKTPAFHEQFVTNESETIFIRRKSKNEVTLQWDTTFQPQGIQRIVSLEDNHILQEWHQLDHLQDIKVQLNNNEPRPFFNLVNKDQDRFTISERELAFQRIYNFRDIGGYLSTQGQVAWGKIYRSGHLGNATNSDLEQIEKLNISTFIDLRDEVEIEKRPDRVPDSVEYKHVFIANRQMVSSSTVLFRRKNLGKEFIESYKTAIIDRGAKGIGKVFRLLSEPENLPAVIHCTAGKDRTGVAVALVLLMLGVPEETVIADYSMSNRFANQLIRANEAWINKGRWLGMRVEHFYPLFSSHPAILQNTLDYVNEKYNSVEHYLLAKVGLEEIVIQNLRKNLLSTS